MGYYTRYELKVQMPPNDGVEDIEAIESVLQKYDCAVSIYESSQETKWYSHEEDMKKVSKRFPKVLFILDGEGEESGDIWRKYFMDGKTQDANTEIKITHDHFDPEKLK